MSDYSTSEVMGLLSGAVVGLGSIGVGIREYLKRERIGNAQDNSQIAGISANDQVIGNMREELNRLAVRVDVLEGQVDELTNKLANVRVIAVDCYALATKCDCHGDGRQMLLDHLKQIIKDA